MTLNVVANGDDDGEGTHVSVYISMLGGKYDAGLKWPYIRNVTLTLLNQLEDKNHCTKTMSFTAAKNLIPGNGRGYSEFIRHSELAHDSVKNTQYLTCVSLHIHAGWKI